MTAVHSTVFYDSDTRRRPLVTEFQNFWRYRGLIRLLVVRDLTVRYKRSVLGVSWTILNPIFTIAILWVVFSNFFRFGIEGDPYVVYLSAGILIATYFSQGLIAAGSAIINSRGVLIKMYIPPEIFSLAAGVAAATHFVLSLMPLFGSSVAARGWHSVDGDPGADPAHLHAHARHRPRPARRLGGRVLPGRA